MRWPPGRAPGPPAPTRRGPPARRGPPSRPCRPPASPCRAVRSFARQGSASPGSGVAKPSPQTALGPAWGCHSGPRARGAGPFAPGAHRPGPPAGGPPGSGRPAGRRGQTARRGPPPPRAHGCWGKPAGGSPFCGGRSATVRGLKPGGRGAVNRWASRAVLLQVQRSGEFPPAPLAGSRVIQFQEEAGSLSDSARRPPPARRRGRRRACPGRAWRGCRPTPPVPGLPSGIRFRDPGGVGPARDAAVAQDAGFRRRPEAALALVQGRGQRSILVLQALLLGDPVRVRRWRARRSWNAADLPWVNRAATRCRGQGLQFRPRPRRRNASAGKCNLEGAGTPALAPLGTDPFRTRTDHGTWTAPRIPLRAPPSRRPSCSRQVQDAPPRRWRTRGRASSSPPRSRRWPPSARRGPRKAGRGFRRSENRAPTR